jgi:hypothetical protein
MQFQITTRIGERQNFRSQRLSQIFPSDGFGQRPGMTTDFQTKVSHNPQAFSEWLRVPGDLCDPRPLDCFDHLLAQRRICGRRIRGRRIHGRIRDD